MDWTWYLFSFEGRINRAKYWLSVLLFIAFLAIAGVVVFAAGFSMAGFVIAGLLYIGFMYVGLAIAVKRLHDRDKSGWWVLVFYILPAVLSGASSGMGGGVAMVLSIASFALSIWGLVELGILRGTMGPNQYGPDPLEYRPG